jgi:DNA-binding protein HU-beta
MNKTQLIEAIAQEATLTKAEATGALNAMTDAITSVLVEGDTVQLTGFGRFLVRERVARTGRNPQTGEAMQIAGSKVATFKMGKVLKEKVNK